MQIHAVMYCTILPSQLKNLHITIKLHHLNNVVYKSSSIDHIFESQNLIQIQLIMYQYIQRGQFSKAGNFSKQKSTVVRVDCSQCIFAMANYSMSDSRYMGCLKVI